MRNIHQGWFMLFLGFLTMVACLGFARFSLGAILPFMKEGLSLSYSQTGWIASSVFFGYLVSAPLAGHFVIRFSSKKVIIFSLGLIILGMLGTANALGFWSAYFFCLLIGIGSGGANIPSVGITANWFVASKRDMAIGLHNSGSSLAIALSGILIPALITINPLAGWRISWYVLALLIGLIILLHVIFLRNTPQEVGLGPIGEKGTNSSLDKEGNTDAVLNEAVYSNKTLWMTGLIYFAFGFSYLIYSTFIVDFLMQDVGMDKHQAGNYFAIIGMTSIVSGLMWGSISDKMGRMATLFVVYTIHTIILLFLTITTHHTLLLLEVIIYALSLWAVPTIMLAFVSDIISPLKAPLAMGFITLFFGVGQFISPIVTGYLLDVQESYTLAFIVSALVSCAGSLGCIALHLKQKKYALEQQPYQVS